MATNEFENWSRRDANLLSASLSESRYSPIPVVEACEQAIEQLSDSEVSDGQHAIPLFEENSPRPTNEYIYYKPDSEEVKIRNDGLRWYPAHRIAGKRLGQRLQWWLSENTLEDYVLDDDQVPPEVIEPDARLSNDETSEFFDAMRGLVKLDRSAERERNREEYESLGFESGIHQEVMAGPLLPLGTEPYHGRRAYKFQLVAPEDAPDDAEPELRDDAEIFPETEYIVGMSEYAGIDSIEMEAVYVGNTELWLCSLDGQINPSSPRHEALTDDDVTAWLHQLLNNVPYKRRLDAVSEVQQNRRKRQLLSGNRAMSFETDKYAVPEPEIDLNDTQLKALIWAEAANDCLCIHGPPGTGKTRTLTAYVRNAVDNGKRVLVAAHSNPAVDNLLVGDSSVDGPESQTLHAMAQNDDTDFTIARAGDNTESRVVKKYYEGRSTSRADIVAATTSGAAQFNTDSFDVAVVDEATQASRAATAIAFNVSEKLILAGDHKQLPPFSASDDRFEDEQRPSLFETLLSRYGDEIAVMLRTQYRMNESIAEFANQSFYEGKLSTADRNRDWTVDDLSPLMGIHIKGTEQKRAAGHTYYNIEEAEAAAKQVKLLTNSGLDPKDIGIIAAYSGQVKEIRQQVQRLDIDAVHQVAINTVDAFQGSEREAIIVSLVRSNPKGSSGFLTIPGEGPRRLNVALTRGRKRLVVIGDWNTLGKRADHRASEESCAGLYSDLEDYIRSLGKML